MHKKLFDSNNKLSNWAYSCVCRKVCFLSIGKNKILLKIIILTTNSNTWSKEVFCKPWNKKKVCKFEISKNCIKII